MCNARGAWETQCAQEEKTMALREHLPHPLYQFVRGFPRDQDSGSIISAWEEQVPTHKPYPNCYWKCWSGRVKDHYMRSFFPRHQVFLIAKSGTCISLERWKSQPCWSKFQLLAHQVECFIFALRWNLPQTIPNNSCYPLVLPYANVHCCENKKTCHWSKCRAC